MKPSTLVLITLFFVFPITTKAQVNLDSLWAIWSDPSQPDTSRLSAMSTFSWEGYVNAQPDSAFYFSQLQYDLAEATGHKNWMANALNTQGVTFMRRGDYSLATEYIAKSLQMSKEIGDQMEVADALANLGSIYWQQGNFAQALDNFSQSLKTYEERAAKKEIATCLYNIGLVFFQQGDLSQALAYLSRSEKQCEEIGKRGLLGKALNILGVIYSGQDDLAQALDYFSRSLKIRKESGQQGGIAGTMTNIGSIYEKLGDGAKAIEYFTQSLEISEERGSKRTMAGTLGAMGNHYFTQGDYSKALEYNTRSLLIKEEIGDKQGIAYSLISIGKEDLRQGNSTRAIRSFTRALTLAQEMGNIESIKSAAWSLFATYKASGKYQQSLEMHERYIQMRDSIQNKENTKILLRNEFEFEYDKQKALDDLENEKELAIETQKKVNQQRLSMAIGIGLLLISLLAIGIFNRLKVTRRQKVIIEEQKARAEQSEKYKEQFLANMSHEIRTPMHAISGIVKILERNKHPASQNVFLHAMHKSADNLLVILNDVLDLSKVEAGKLNIESIPMNPAKVVENAIEILAYKAEEKGLALHFSIADDVPEFVMGDPNRLYQILINLGGNAIKFTEKGNIEILLSKEENHLRFCIKDTGIGIPNGKLETIFEAFEQAKDPAKRYYGGTGLGLSISKQLIELQNGKIWAESEEGQGSRFYVELLILAATGDAIDQDLISEDQLKSMAASLRGIRILLAEDDEYNQMIAQDDLSFYIEDVKIDRVKNGTLAIEKFKTEEYDLILMDVQMPEINGMDATEKIRKFEASADKEFAIPIVAMTASLLKSEINSCLKAGMDSYISKPYKIEELIGTIYKETPRYYN